MPERGTLVALSALAILGAGAGGWALRGVLGSERPAVHAADDARDARADILEVAALPLPTHIRALVVGGGPYPSANEVQLEDDLALARSTFGTDGTVLLFAGGPGTRAVRIEPDGPPEATLRDTLAEIFAGASSRGSTFRPTVLEVHGPARLAASLELLVAARDDTGAPPLLFYFAGHGDGGDAPEAATALFWGGEALDPAWLADELDAGLVGEGGARPSTTSGPRLDHEPPLESRRAASGTQAPRRLRIVMTSCYAGGFADIVFAGADPARGPTPDDRCGLFATTWDLEASGCDADPDRARHEGYGVHFLSALSGRARDGTDARASIDLDRDGTITLSEAHARARVASRSIDVPTSTSARLIEELARDLEPVDAPPITWREEEAVRDGLGEALDIRVRADADRRESDAQTHAVELDAAREEAQAECDEAWTDLTSALLSRWPVLDDPWHREFDTALSAEAANIEGFLETSPAFAAWTDASRALDALDADDGALMVELALVRRYIEADETLIAAGRIAAASLSDWQTVLRVRACEESAP